VSGAADERADGRAGGRPDALAAMALAAIHREYPNHLLHLLHGDADALPPRVLHPAFYGSFDWHSAVHGHWCLARLARLHPAAPFAAPARSALAESLTPARLAAEHAYLSGEGRQAFERPYGLAWLLQLAAELREWGSVEAPARRSAEPAAPGSAEAARWHAALEPLERVAARRLADWLPKLEWPVRGGEHSQTAFALGLALDWARTAADGELEAVIVARAEAFYGADVEAPIAYEPSGQDFLSPVLAEADLMRRVRAPAAFAQWLHRFLPDLEAAAARRWLAPVASPDRADGKLAHLDGLNLSRAWMLEGIVSALAPTDRARPALEQAARRHREAGLAGATGEHYAGGHWLGSFAAYLISRRGLGPESVR
jgi:hypothetical protein